MDASTAGIYFVLAAWFCAADMVAGRIAGSPYRPIGAVVLALVWPVSLALALVAAASVVRGLRQQIAELSKEPQ